MRYRPVDVAIGRSDQNDAAGPCGQRRRGCFRRLAKRAVRSAGAVRRVDADRGPAIPDRYGPRAVRRRPSACRPRSRVRDICHILYVPVFLVAA
jgi:hypothetical protein